MATQCKVQTFGHGTQAVLKVGSGGGFKWKLDPVPAWTKIQMIWPIGGVTGGPDTGNLTTTEFAIGFSNYAGDQYGETTPQHVFGFGTGSGATTFTGNTDPATSPTPNSNYRWAFTTWAFRYQAGSRNYGAGNSSGRIANHDQYFTTTSTYGPAQPMMWFGLDKTVGAADTWRASYGLQQFPSDDPDEVRELVSCGLDAASGLLMNNLYSPIHQYAVYNETGLVWPGTALDHTSVDEATYGVIDGIYAYWDCGSHGSTSVLFGRPIVIVCEP